MYWLLGENYMVFNVLPHTVFTIHFFFRQKHITMLCNCTYFLFPRAKTAEPSEQGEIINEQPSRK